MKTPRPEHHHSTRDEVRELAESLSLFRSAMRHVADRKSAGEMPSPLAAKPRRRLAGLRFPLPVFLIAGPMLATALFLAALPIYHHYLPKPAENNTTVATAPPAAANDAELLSQIDDEISENVPDALQPLTDYDASTGISPTNSAMEKKHATQE